jgi:hypothetical protein
MADSIFDHFPIIGTARRALAHWTGGEMQDYISCAVTKHTCVGLGKRIAETQCTTCIDQMRDVFIKDLPSPSIVKGVMETLVTGIAATVGWKLIMSAGLTEGVKLLGKALVGLGVVFLIDMIVDIWMYVYRKGKVEEAAEAAKAHWCVCENYEGMPD